MRKSLFIGGGVAVILLAGAITWLTAAPSIGPTAVNPAYIVINTPTQVTVAASISDSSLITTSVNLLRTDATGKTLGTVGVMKDDGINGDAKAGDKTFSYRMTMNQPSVGEQYFRVSAAFKGVLMRALSPVQIVHVDPFKLPPDPGEAGKLTLEGIDSDFDGVRDDVQRYIALRFPSDSTSRAALRQYASSVESFLAADESTSSNSAKAVQRSIKCLYLINPTGARELRRAIQVAVLNTRTRVGRWFQLDGTLQGTIFLDDDESDFVGAHCGFSPSSLN